MFIALCTSFTHLSHSVLSTSAPSVANPLTTVLLHLSRSPFAQGVATAFTVLHTVQITKQLKITRSECSSPVTNYSRRHPEQTRHNSLKGTHYRLRLLRFPRFNYDEFCKQLQPSLNGTCSHWNWFRTIPPDPHAPCAMALLLFRWDEAFPACFLDNVYNMNNSSMPSHIWSPNVASLQTNNYPAFSLRCFQYLNDQLYHDTVYIFTIWHPWVLPTSTYYPSISDKLYCLLQHTHRSILWSHCFSPYPSIRYELWLAVHLTTGQPISSRPPSNQSG